MRVGNKELLLVNDRVLIRLEKADERTQAGLYLPQTAVSKASVQTGRVVEVGPGIPLPVDPNPEEEPWREHTKAGHYIPLQAEMGDQAMFLRDQAVDVKVDGDDYVVVPHSAMLVLLRDDVFPITDDK